MKLFIVPLLLLTLVQARAGGIRGTVFSDDGTPLAFASIFIRQTGTGVATDIEGRYEVALPPGTYEVVYQYLGYETVTRTVAVDDSFQTLAITLKTQVVMLQSVTVRAGKEDPAYTIMRKAIAKARYHTQQLDSYQAQVYIKGKGQLKDYPWYARKMLEKEGITKDRLFISESVSEITYQRPNEFKEKVIAVYTQGDANNTSPNSYVFGSFYNPEIAETISPLSPKAFSYYRFEYLGTFADQGQEVSKIKVIPRSRGDNVFEGTISVIEGAWSLHSVDLQVVKMGIRFFVQQLFQSVSDAAHPQVPVWMPVSQQYRVEGKIFGFAFEGNYLATVRNYVVRLNPDLPLELVVIDEKVEKEEARAIEQKLSKKTRDINERLQQGQEVSRKELNELVRAYEKQEMRERKDGDVISVSSYRIDSMAYKKDSLFWTSIRPAALTAQEQRGYAVADSLDEVERKREAGDSLKPSKNKGFQILDIVRGDRYRLNQNEDFEILTPYGGFNTVEGWNLIYRVAYYKRWSKQPDTTVSDRVKRPVYRWLRVMPVARYAFAREQVSGFLRVDYRTKGFRYTAEAGRYVEQYNDDRPILPLVNTFSTLLWGDNLMKLYERDFITQRFERLFNDKFSMSGDVTFAQRRELVNNSSYVLFNRYRDSYTPNAPQNNELANTGFDEHRALTAAVRLEARPWQKYRIRNGVRQRVSFSSPTLLLEYRKGIPHWLGSEVSFDFVEVGVRHQQRFGIRGTLDLMVRGGTFLTRDRLFFMDYQHFLGNRTWFMTTDPVGSYRLLDYYRYSTSREYLAINSHYHLRKFLVTRIPKVRLVGVTENLFVGMVATATAGTYTEVGYGLDGILRLFRLEAAMSFSNGNWQNFDYGFRIGIATSLTINFSD